jgi:hypothetical protein
LQLNFDFAFSGTGFPAPTLFEGGRALLEHSIVVSFRARFLGEESSEAFKRLKSSDFIYEVLSANWRASKNYCTR